MWVKMRYVVVKRNRRGDSRWYWERRGFKTRRLPDSEVARVAEATRLNERADAEKAAEPGEPEFGTIAWAIAEYRASPSWQRLAVSTRRHYQPFMVSLDNIQGFQPVTALTRSAVREVLSAIDSPGRKKHCHAVLTRILGVAQDHDLIAHNPAHKMGLAGSGKRDQLWTDADIERFLGHCTGPHGAALALHFQLMIHTAQRPGDCWAMQWQAYDGRKVKLVQQKTGKPLWIDCPARLVAVLDEARKQAGGMAMIAAPDGQRLGLPVLRKAFSNTRARAGLDHLQARDLRRTAIVRLAEAGCTVPEIAAISGHNVDRTAQILEVYLPRTRAMASSAIAKLDEYRK